MALIVAHCARRGGRRISFHCCGRINGKYLMFPQPPLIFDLSWSQFYSIGTCRELFCPCMYIQVLWEIISPCLYSYHIMIVTHTSIYLVYKEINFKLHHVMVLFSHKHYDTHKRLSSEQGKSKKCKMLVFF